MANKTEKTFSRFTFTPCDNCEAERIFNLIDNRFQMADVEARWEGCLYVVEIVGEGLVYSDLQYIHRNAPWDDFVVNAKKEA